MIDVIDCGIGNIGSIINMLQYIGHHARRAGTTEAVMNAERIILPGVGAFDTGMQHLEERGLAAPLREKVRSGTLLLGICLGMQMLFESSEEGERPGFGWIRGKVRRFDAGSHPHVRIPHIGWANVTPVGDSFPLGNLESSRFYFVHSYHAECSPAYTVGTAHHGYDFPAIVSSENVLGTQFHPEKSHKFGMQLLNNFAMLKM
jgi:glutamine amidotransferase